MAPARLMPSDPLPLPPAASAESPNRRGKRHEPRSSEAKRHKRRSRSPSSGTKSRERDNAPDGADDGSSTTSSSRSGLSSYSHRSRLRSRSRLPSRSSSRSPSPDKRRKRKEGRSGKRPSRIKVDHAHGNENQVKRHAANKNMFLRPRGKYVDGLRVHHPINQDFRKLLDYQTYRLAPTPKRSFRERKSHSRRSYKYMVQMSVPKFDGNVPPLVFRFLAEFIN